MHLHGFRGQDVIDSWKPMVLIESFFFIVEASIKRISSHRYSDDYFAVYNTVGIYRPTNQYAIMQHDEKRDRFLSKKTGCITGYITDL